MRLYGTLALTAVIALSAANASAQSNAARPNLGPVVPSLEFRAALNNQTRSATGQPGPRYWQNSASYKINARIDPDSKRLDGSVEITYRNYSLEALEGRE